MKRLQAKKDREYRLMPLTPTEATVRKPRLIFINGFLQEDVDKADDWLAAVDARFAENGKFHWQWPAGSLEKYLKKLSDLPLPEERLFVEAKKVLEGLVKPLNYKKMALFASILLRSIRQLLPGRRPMAWVGSIVLMGGLFWAIYNFLKTWHEAREHAEEAGVKLADQLVRRAEERQETFILMGHSLGARVARACVHELHRRNRSHIVEDMYLLSGAVASGPWEEVIGGISGKIYNFYAPRDLVVGPLYKASGCWEEAIGVAEIPDTGTGKVKNHDVTSILDRYPGASTLKFIPMRYKCAFGDMLAACVPDARRNLPLPEAPAGGVLHHH